MPYSPAPILPSCGKRWNAEFHTSANFRTARDAGSVIPHMNEGSPSPASPRSRVGHEFNKVYAAAGASIVWLAAGFVAVTVVPKSE